MRTTYSRPVATTIALLGAMILLTGCGSSGAMLPPGTNVPSEEPMGVVTPVDDPIMAGYDGVDTIESASMDDPYAQAVSDWNETTGSLGGVDDFSLDDEPLPVGYGGGYGDDYGYGGYGFASGYGYGGGLVDDGLMSAGFEDPGFPDPGFDDMGGGFDAGLEDPGFVDGGFDAGFVDVGMDAGFVDAGFDAGAMDVGMDAGFADVGMVDVGGFDAGIGF
jgi:hypothetical protein